MEQLQIFNSLDFGQIRVMAVKGMPMFVANDIAGALGYADTQQAIRTHCISDDDSKLQVVYIPHGNGYGGTKLKLIDESNVYLLIMRSRLPQAQKLQNWICREIMPSMRTKRKEVVNRPEDSPNKIMAQALLIAQDTIEVKQSQIDSLEVIVDMQHKEIETLLPKAEYYDEGMELQGAYTITQIAKGLGMTSQKLNQLLYKWRIQYRQTNTWLLYATYQNQGYMRIVPEFKTKENGETYSCPKSVWTEKGRAFIHKLVKEYTV